MISRNNEKQNPRGSNKDNGLGLYSLVSVATAAKYDLTTNTDDTDGRTKGAECVMEIIDYRVENSTRPSIIIWVSFPHPDMKPAQKPAQRKYTFVQSKVL